MKKANHSILLLLFSAWAAMSATVNITGTVTKTGGGALKDVTLSLAKVSGISATTDATGKFTLASDGVVNIISSKSMSLQFGLKGKDLVFYSASGKISGIVAVFSPDGKQLVSMNFKALAPSTQKVTLPSFAQGLNIIRITADNNTYTCPIFQMGSNLYQTKSSGLQAKGTFRLAKSTAGTTIDTLIAKKTGYTDKKTPISSYTLSDLAISMDSAGTKVCNATTLKEAGACSHNILIGTAMSPAHTSSSIATQEFNFVTPENEMKWQNTEASENSFTFSSADQIVSWAQQNGIKVKGHCLVWHSQLAGWVSQAKGHDRVLGIMKNHIEQLMGHFGNKVYAWDVVNEAIATDDDVGTGNPRLRSDVFLTEIGNDYIQQAFKIAREYADSHDMKNMKLYYNDYSIDADNDKSKFAHQLIKSWVDSGVPVDGIGFQMHIGPPNNIPTAESVRANMQFYADLGLEVLISEWDINLCGNKVTSQQQLQLYHDITAVCVNQPRCTAITFWGINDGDSWLNSFDRALCNGQNSQSLLFNNDQKKTTYTQVLNALNGK